MDGTRNSADQAARGAADRVGEAASRASGAIGQFASEQADKAKRSAEGMFEERRTATAQGLERMTDALRESAKSIKQEGDSEMVANLAEAAASQLERFNETLRTRSMDDWMSEATDFARRRPIAMFAGAVAIGFLAARFFKNAGEPEGQSYGQQRDYTQERSSPTPGTPAAGDSYDPAGSEYKPAGTATTYGAG